MVLIQFREPDGKVHDLYAEEGRSIMELAVSNDLPGITAECGGACACATCHIMVEDKWMDKLPKIGTQELGMLEFANGRTRNSRLACQITITKQLNGIRIDLPDFPF